MNLPYEAPPTTLHYGLMELVLDVHEVYPDDPGYGCPALVKIGDQTASYECATNEGELVDDKGYTYKLSLAQMRWLDEQQKYVDEVWRQGKERDAVRKALREQQCKCPPKRDDGLKLNETGRCYSCGKPVRE